ncbi:MAG: hypothetical protein ICV76_04000 [Nitrospiraceae bacterium]|nr:hypothetical protein [Nitrospiraceae bacterium]
MAKPLHRFEKVLLSSGHMIDAPGRVVPRFPPAKESAVRERIAAQLDQWEVGEHDLGIFGGARGGDIVFAEQCLGRGAHVWMFLPLREPEFLEQSVRLPNSNWEQRFFALRKHPKCETSFLDEKIGPPPKGMTVFEQNNLRMIDTARAEAHPGRLYAVLVWDEKSTGDGLGGTSDFATKVKQLGGRVAVINPMLVPG